ncbi:unnamed protein product [Tilletia laevis]|uniref:Tyr recombinase domain-containing protein n=1 Tax=Tilletia laevis TaxID=157183 RepID=A0A9N8QBP8_9BASI|nr:unnamed protein product [Tilletia caries]CAD6922163.1 unnamed protein product [Tilletia laevis]
MEDVRSSTYTYRRAGLSLWHHIHGFDLKIDEQMSRRLGRAARLCQPEAMPSRPPVRIADLGIIRNGLPIERDRAMAAVWACVSFAFFGLARLGELTVETLSEPRDRLARCLRLHWTVRPAEGSAAPTVTLRLPMDKTQGPNGSDLIASQQLTSPALCPVAAVRWHLHVNRDVPQDAGAFAFLDSGGCVRELTTDHCIRVANSLLSAADRPPILGHCLRIGGATFYLNAGIPELDIRRHGRWKSDAMLVYLRRLYVSAGRVFAHVDTTNG